MDGRVEERVNQCVADILIVIDAEIGRDDTLVEDLGADEVDLSDLAAALNKEFEIEISAEQMEGVHTVRDLVALVRSKRPFE
jgi:acyl carrier protein